MKPTLRIKFFKPIEFTVGKRVYIVNRAAWLIFKWFASRGIGLTVRNLPGESEK